MTLTAEMTETKILILLLITRLNGNCIYGVDTKVAKWSQVISDQLNNFVCFIFFGTW